jgi:hypothetical protein
MLVSIVAVGATHGPESPKKAWVARTLYVRVAQRQEANGVNLSSAAAYKLIKGSKERPLVPSEPGSRVPRDSVRATLLSCHL